jgi:small-conductance mechanosensitive channel
MGLRGLPRERLIRFNFIGELKYDAAMREHHGGLFAGRRNLRIVVGLLAVAIVLLVAVGRTSMAVGLAAHGSWILMILVVIEVVYRWVARRLPADPVG